MAAIWDVWFPSDKRDAPPLYSCSIITGPANALVAPIHGRMPVILTGARARSWLDPELDEDVEQIRRLLDDGDPARGVELVQHPVSTDVNSPDNDDAHLIEPIELAQPSLF